MRSCILHLKLVARGLGPVPWLLLGIYCIVASLQEPVFFRALGLELQWPGCAVVESFLTFAAYLLWAEITASNGARTQVWPGAIALVIVAVAFALVGGIACCILDLAHGLPLAPTRLPVQALRTVQIWAPLAVLATALAPSFRFMSRFALLSAAFLVQTTLHRVSMPDPGPGVSNFVASLLAISGSIALVFASRPEATRAT